MLIFKFKKKDAVRRRNPNEHRAAPLLHGLQKPEPAACKSQSPPSAKARSTVGKSQSSPSTRARSTVGKSQSSPSARARSTAGKSLPRPFSRSLPGQDSAPQPISASRFTKKTAPSTQQKAQR